MRLSRPHLRKLVSALEGSLGLDLVGVRVGFGAFAGQLCERSLHLSPHPSDGNAEYALSALDQIDHLVLRCAFVHRSAIRHQGDLRQVFDTRSRRCSIAARICCSETPVSSRRLTTFSTRMSRNEYRRAEPDPDALRSEGCTSLVRAQ